MEIHTPTAAERYTTIRGRVCARLEAEGARYGIARMVDLIILELLTFMISWAISRAEQRLLGANPQSLAHPRRKAWPKAWPRAAEMATMNPGDPG